MGELNLEAINKIRTLNGQEPLTELPKKEEPVIAPVIEMKTPEQIAEEEKAKKTKTKEEPIVVVPELNSDAVLEYLRKQGISAASLDDLKPKEDAATLAEKREADKLSWALSKGKLTKKEHESFVIDSNNPQDFVFRSYYKEAKAADPELSDEEIQAEFAQKFGLDAEPGTRKFKQGQQDLALVSDQMLRMRHGKIFGIENEYSNYENGNKQQQEFNKKVISGLPDYQKEVGSVIAELKKIPVAFSDSEQYEVEAIEDSLKQIESELLSTDFVARKISGGYSKEELKEIAFTRYLRMNFPAITQNIVNQALLKNQKGTRGIIPKTLGANEDKPQLTPEQQKYVDLMNANKPAAAVAN